MTSKKHYRAVIEEDPITKGRYQVVIWDGVDWTSRHILLRGETIGSCRYVLRPVAWAFEFGMHAAQAEVRRNLTVARIQIDSSDPAQQAKAGAV